MLLEPFGIIGHLTYLIETLETVDIIGHVAYLFILSGMVLLGRKNIWGWPLKSIGDLIWLGLGVHMGMTSIWMWEIGFLVTTILGYRDWKRKDKAQ